MQRVALAAILTIGLAAATLIFYRPGIFDRPSRIAYHVGKVGESPCLCLDAGVHNQLAYISTGRPRAKVEFLGPYHLSGNSTNWWEIVIGNDEIGNDLCLEPNPKLGWLVGAESCQPTNENKWFDNDSGRRFQNAGGTLADGKDAWLWWNKTDCDTASDVCKLRIVTYTTQPLQWWEGPVP